MSSAKTFELFKLFLVISLLYSFFMTGITYALPDAANDQISLFVPTHSVDLEDYADEVRDKADQSMVMPMIDLGALIFFSGNLLIDLMLNMLFAVPEMVMILVSGLMYFAPIDPFLATQIKVFVFAIIALFYIIAIFALLINARSQGGIT